jgi:hypothetical protein
MLSGGERRQERHPSIARRRRGTESRLGGNVAANVSHVGRPPRLRQRSDRLHLETRRFRSVTLTVNGPNAFGYIERDRRAPSRAHLAVRRQQAPAHLFSSLPFCRTSGTPSRSRSRRTTCGSTPGRAGRAGRRSTRPTPPSASRTCHPASSWPVKMRGRSTATRTRP